MYDTNIDDLWETCTKPERLARWIAEVSGDLRHGGEFEASFTRGWEGVGRVDVCEPPRRLLVCTTESGESDATVVEVTLTRDGDQTKLIIDERGLPIDQLRALCTVVRAIQAFVADFGWEAKRVDGPDRRCVV